MPQSYKSAISFGLVFVPITLHVAVKSRDIGFNMLYKKTGERIKYKKTCESCPDDLPLTDIVRGFQFEKGRYVTLTNKELEDLKTPRDKSIDIVQFVQLPEIDPIYFEKSYYVKPTDAQKAFCLIAKALEDSNLVGIAKTVLGTREQVVALRMINGKMMLSTMHFHDEVQLAPFVARGVATATELKLAKQLITQMTKKFDPTAFKDEYRERLQQAIDAKIKGEDITGTSAPTKAKIIDLMEALRKSVETSRREPIKRGGTRAVKSGKGTVSKRDQAKRA